MKIKCSDRYETLYTDDNGDESYNSYDSSTPSDSSTSSEEISDEISLKRKEMRRKDRRNVIKEKDEKTKERTGNLHIHKIGININLKQLSKEYSQLLVVLLRKIA